MTFYVIDTVERTPSWSTKDDKGERFGSYKAAEKRAKELADMEPGKCFEIVQSVADVVCPVGQARVTAR